jgi:EAL domain-containing protein (putative c-di-GMP-specific phosphodiesterase class I)
MGGKQAVLDERELHTEWLQLRSRLYDTLTGLPTLPAIADDVRRMIERHGSAGVLYLDLGRSGWQETQLGWESYDQAVRQFARLLESGRLTGEIGEEDLFCVDTVRSDRFVVFLAGRSSDGLLAMLRHRLDDAPPQSFLHAVRLSIGQANVRFDPMVRTERAMQQAVTDAMLMSLVKRQERETMRLHELTRLIAERGVRSVFHPIVRLKDGSVIGHEALTRPLRGVPFDSVEDLFAFAEGTELLVDFEALCRSSAISGAKDVAGCGLLFLNASARAVSDPRWSLAAVGDLLAVNRLRPQDVVVEITERVGIESRPDFERALAAFKEHGYRVAVDDVGSGHASLKALTSIEPDFLKCDMSLVRGVDRSRIKQGLLESLGALAEKMKARVIAEGVEREEERATLVDMGIELGQGYLFHPEAHDR